MRVYSLFLLITILSSGIVNARKDVSLKVDPTKDDLCMYNKVSSMTKRGQILAFTLTRTTAFKTRFTRHTSITVEQPTTQTVTHTTHTTTTSHAGDAPSPVARETKIGDLPSPAVRRPQTGGRRLRFLAVQKFSLDFVLK